MGTCFFKKGSEQVETQAGSLWEIGATDIDGQAVARLGDLCAGKKCVMVVNVASK